MSEATAGEFSFTRLERVIFGAGCVSQLGRELERHGRGRALIVTGASLGRSRLLERVRDSAGAAFAGVFAGAVQHTPSATVDALAEAARGAQADCLVSFGGGSPIDTAKAAAMKLLAERELVHIAIPTTLSAAEFTPFGGVTNEATREKGGVGDRRLQPRTVILDPELTLATPAWLWAGSGIRALDHAVESACSARHQPLSDALTARAIELLGAHLLASLQSHGADELEHRVHCQLAAWFSIFGAMNTRTGISHALGHQIGPMWNVPHGFTSCITLPHVMRFMARVAPERFGPVAQGFGLRFDSAHAGAAATECAERAARLIAQFEVPTRLRDVGVPRDELGRIAATVLAEVQRAATVGRAVSIADVEALLDAAY
jgi:maleylacetate reductase